MPFLPAGVGTALAVGAATAAVGAGATALLSSGKGAAQSGAIAQGQQQANAALAPYSTTGVQSDTRSADLLGLNGQDAADTAFSTYQKSPGYQFQLDQGLRAVDAGAAAKGMARSGATIKGEEAFGQGLASQDFGNYMSRLNSLSNYGITAAGGQAAVDTSAAGAQSGILGTQANSTSNALSSLAGNQNVQNGLTGLFSGNGALSANSLNTNLGTQFGQGTFPTSSNPNAVVSGYQSDGYTPIASYS